jgi:hypothetical protein
MAAPEEVLAELTSRMPRFVEDQYSLLAGRTGAPTQVAVRPHSRSERESGRNCRLGSLPLKSAIVPVPTVSTNPSLYNRVG